MFIGYVNRFSGSYSSCQNSRLSKRLEHVLSENWDSAINSCLAIDTLTFRSVLVN